MTLFWRVRIRSGSLGLSFQASGERERSAAGHLSRPSEFSRMPVGPWWTATRGVGIRALKTVCGYPDPGATRPHSTARMPRRIRGKLVGRAHPRSHSAVPSYFSRCGIGIPAPVESSPPAGALPPKMTISRRMKRVSRACVKGFRIPGISARPLLAAAALLSQPSGQGLRSLCLPVARDADAPPNEAKRGGRYWLKCLPLRQQSSVQNRLHRASIPCDTLVSCVP
ncbi:hypothetical protein C8Q73DRAFT_71640 [Cubamyces lactineus]|nr:hypothetical protein C8Q73DRAFT_71640 [Cubamyces lactineus]